MRGGGWLVLGEVGPLRRLLTPDGQQVANKDGF